MQKLEKTAFQNGNTVILEELVKAGAVVAPATVSNKLLVTQHEVTHTGRWNVIMSIPEMKHGMAVNST